MTRGASWSKALRQLGLVATLIELLARGNLRIKRAPEWSAVEMVAAELLLCSRAHRPWLGAHALVQQSAGSSRRPIGRVTGLAGDTCGGQSVPPGRVCIDETEVQSLSSVAVVIAVLRSLELIDMRVHIRSGRRDLRATFTDKWADLSRRLDSGGLARADTFGYSPTRYYAFTPTPWEVARSFLTRLDISTEDVFLDYGCGKGRVLTAALEHPFKRVVGIEIIPAHAAAARRNLRRWGNRVEVIEADAGNVALPDDATVLYAFNPFGAATVSEVMRRVGESLSRRPRQIRLVTYGISPALLAPLVPYEAAAVGPGTLHFYLIPQPPRSARSTPA